MITSSVVATAPVPNEESPVTIDVSKLDCLIFVAISLFIYYAGSSLTSILSDAAGAVPKVSVVPEIV